MKHYGFAALAAAALSAVIPQATLAEDLVLSIGSRGYGPSVERNLTDYAKDHPDVNIEWNKVSDVPGETRKLYVTSLTAQSPTPDIIALDVIWAGEFAQRGWLAPLGDLMSEDQMASFNPALLSAATVDDQTYAVPLYVDGTHLFYRTDLLEKYGLEVPKTWEDLIAASQTIMEGEGNPQFYGFVSMWAKIEGLFMNWLSFVNANGGGFFDENGNLAINSPANIEATQTMVDIMYEYRIAPDSILNMRPDDARTLFQQGRAAFLMVQGFVQGPLSAPDSPVAGKFDFTRNPYFEGHEDAHSTAMGGWYLGVNANSENKQAAADLVAYFTSFDRQLQAAYMDNRAPTVPAVYDDPKMGEAEILAKFGKNYDVGVVRPSAETGEFYPRVSETMQLEVTNALHRQKTVEEALNDAQEQVTAILGN